MIYRPEIGKIYDTIFFFCVYFDKSCSLESFSNTYRDTKFMEECYNTVRAEVNSVPDFLLPFFHSNEGLPSVLSDFFVKYADFETETIESFLQRLITNSADLHKATVDCVFAETEEAERTTLISPVAPGKYIEALKALNVPSEYKLQISILFSNFSYAISVLSFAMREVYSAVDRLYALNEEKLQHKFEGLQAEADRNSSKRSLKLPASSSENDANMSICLLNQYIFHFSVRKGDPTNILIGFCYEESLEKDEKTKKIRPEIFIEALGNKLRMKIISKLTKNGPMTCSQLSRALHVPATTVSRHMDVLSDCEAVTISRVEGCQTFYDINIKMFKQMKTNINTMFDKIIERKSRRL